MICDLELWLISDFLAQHVCSESRVSKKMDIRNMWECILLKGVPHRTIAWITFRGPQPWFGAALSPIKTCFSHIGNYRETVGNHPTGSLRIWRQKNHLLPVFFSWPRCFTVRIRSGHGTALNSIPDILCGSQLKTQRVSDVVFCCLSSLWSIGFPDFDQCAPSLLQYLLLFVLFAAKARFVLQWDHRLRLICPQKKLQGIYILPESWVVSG